MCEWLDRLKKIPGTIISISPETINVFPFEGLLDNLVIVVSHYHEWVDLWRNETVRVFCLGEIIDDPPQNTFQLLNHPKTTQFIHSLPAPHYILVFKNSAKIETWARQNHCCLLSAKSTVARPLENKLRLESIGSACKINCPSTRIVNLNSDTFSYCDLNPSEQPFIAQFAKGFSGNRTFLIHSENDFKLLVHRFKNRKIKTTSFIPGDTWTANGCVNREEITVDTPFLQVTRINPSREINLKTVGSRGNIWGTCPPDLIEKINTAMLKIGDYLRHKGFRGIFGVDFIWNETLKRLVLIELNPRIVASISARSSLKIKYGGIPLIARHILSFVDDYPKCLNVSDSPLLPSGQIIYRKGDQYLTRTFKTSGIYHIERQGNRIDRLNFKIKSWRPSEISSEQCLLWQNSSLELMINHQRIIFHCRDDESPQRISNDLFKYISKKNALE